LAWVVRVGALVVLAGAVAARTMGMRTPLFSGRYGWSLWDFIVALSGIIAVREVSRHAGDRWGATCTV
jgi:hypothetical protein